MTRLNFRGLGMAMLAALLMGGCSPVPTRGGGGSTPAKGSRLADLQVTPNPHLGLAFPGKFTQYYRYMSEAGIGIVRLSVPWSTREPRPGQYQWADLDEAVRAIEDLGMQAFLTLDSEADWGVEPSKKPARNRPPRDLAVWQKFVTAVVERYDHDGKADCPGLKSPIPYYQVANEWISENNASGGWTGTDDQLIAFINASYDAVKKADPRAEFVMGGIAAINLDVMALASGLADYTAVTGANRENRRTFTPAVRNDPQIQEYVKKASRVLTSTRFDMADLHLYGPVSHYDARIAVLSQKVPHGLRLISSECGGPSLAYDPDETISQEDHFLAVMDINLYALSHGLEFCLWLSLGESAGGQTWGNSKVPLFDRNRKPKGGYWAYKLLALVLKDMASVQRVHDGFYLISRADGARTGVCWRTGDQRTMQVPAGFHAVQAVRITDAASGSYQFENLPPAGAGMPLDDRPLIISEKLLFPVH